MYDKLKSLTADISIYGLAELLNRMMQVLFLPIIFIYIKPHDFGVLDFFLTAKNLLSIGLGWGIITAIQRYAYKDIEAKFTEVVSVSIWYILIIDIVIGLLILIGLYVFLNENNIVYFDAVVVTVSISVSFALRSVALGVLRLKRKPKKFLIVTVSNVVFYLLLTFLFIKFLDLTYMAFLYGGLIAIMLSTLIGILFIREWITLNLNLNLARRILGFGVSVLSTSMAFQFINSSNRFFLKINNSFSDIAMLGMANRLSVFVGGLLIAPFGLAWLPFVNENFSRNDFPEIFRKVYIYVTYVGLLLTLTISLFASNILDLANDIEYVNSAIYVPIFSLVFVFQGFYYLFSTGIYLQKGRKNYYTIALVSSIFNIVMYILLLNVLNVMIVSLITLGTYVLIFLMAYYFGQKMIQVSVFNTEVVSCFLTFIVLMVVNLNYLPAMWAIHEIVFKILSVVVFVGLLFIIPSMRKDVSLIIAKIG